MQALQKQSYTTVADMLKKNAAAIAASMPRHMSVDRMTRVALSELRTNPALLNCHPASLINSITKAAQLGLEVGGALGHAYLVPYKAEASLIIGYRGLIALARRSGEILSISAHCVHEADVFDFEYGLDEKLRHIPSIGERGELTHAYAIAKLRDGGVQYDVMTRSEIDAIRKRSRAGNSGPWVTDYEEMARKTVVRRLCKYLPISVELSEAIANDERMDISEIVVTGEKDLTSTLLESNQKTAGDKTTDSNGEVWNPDIHAAGKNGEPVYNKDGSFRARRGTKNEPEPAQEPEQTVTLQQLKKLVDGAESVDMLEEIEDLARELPDEKDQSEITAAITAKMADMRR